MSILCHWTKEKIDLVWFICRGRIFLEIPQLFVISFTSFPCFDTSYHSHTVRWYSFRMCISRWYEGLNNPTTSSYVQSCCVICLLPSTLLIRSQFKGQVCCIVSSEIVLVRLDDRTDTSRLVRKQFVCPHKTNWRYYFWEMYTWPCTRTRSYRLWDSPIPDTLWWQTNKARQQQSKTSQLMEGKPFVVFVCGASRLWIRDTSSCLWTKRIRITSIYDSRMFVTVFEVFMTS